VGSVLPSVELKIADDGEILAKGPTIFDGYFGADELNNQVFEDGYFRTGDLGAIDAQGYLKITGRKKDLIINSAGKNIAPQRIENIMKTLPMTNQVVVFGDKKKHLVALITLDESQALEFAKEKSWSVNSMQELSQHPELLKLFRDEIKARSAELADYERIRNFRILERDFSVEEGELTATLKVKRNIVSTKYFDIIESLYDKEEAASLLSSKR
jgi:long-chain acyl-CoA synthetase